MEELFETLTNLCCFDEDVLSLEDACLKLGLNYEKILQHAQTDPAAAFSLQVCLGTMKYRVFEKYYQGTMSKSDCDRLVYEHEALMEIYASTKAFEGE